MNFVCLDFETANRNRHSACSVAICEVVNGEITTQKSWLIRPKNNSYSMYNTEVHGIDASMTENSSEFPEVWRELQPLLLGKIIVCHNASFDESVLFRTLELYELPFNEKDFKFVCSMKLAKWLMPFIKDGYSLPNLCEILNVEVDKSKLHRADYDTFELAKLMIAFTEKFSLDDRLFPITPEKEPKKKKSSNGFSEDEIKQYKETISVRKIDTELKYMKEDVADTSHFFYQKKVVITGTFQNFPIRNDMAKLLHEVGADINTSISKKTDYVIVGNGAGPSKLQKIKELDIQAIEEEEFLQIMQGAAYEK